MSDIGKKIKAAITDKLKELDVYVDDELSEYIFMLVENKKSREQMNEDLSLFLVDHTEKFTEWLHESLKNIRESTISNNESSIQSSQENDAAQTKSSPQPIEEKKKKQKKKKEKKEKKKKKDKNREKGLKSKKKHVKSVSSSEDDAESKSAPKYDSSKSDDHTETVERGTVAKVTPSSLVSQVKIAENNVIEKPSKDSVALSEKPRSREVKNFSITKILHKDAKEAPTNIKVVISNENAERHNLTDSDSANSPDRLGSVSNKRFINLRDESSFLPAKPGHANSAGRVISSALASAIKSAVIRPDEKPAKRLEARVRPLVNFSRNDGERQDNGIKDRLRSGISVSRKRNRSDDDSENEEPSPKKTASIVSKIEVAPRPKRSAVQANSSLVLRAMADANKSVSEKTKLAIQEQDTLQTSPSRNEIFTKSYLERNHSAGMGASAKPLGSFEVTVSNASLKDRLGAKVISNASDHPMEDDEAPKPAVLRKRPLVSSKIAHPHAYLPAQLDQPEKPRFLITMDNELIASARSGHEYPSRLSSKASSMDEEEFVEEEIEEWEEIEEMDDDGMDQTMRSSAVAAAQTLRNSTKTTAKTEQSTTLIEAKIGERCRFWPKCKEGDACQYVHPSKECMNFPQCRFGDKCIYIHPKCKFDAACTKPACPYLHLHPRVPYIQPTPVPVPKTVNFPLAKVKCRYYPKCTDMNCPYAHPKDICRWGSSCLTPNCLYVHPQDGKTTTTVSGIPKASSLKWIAPKAPPQQPTTTSTASEAIAASQ